MLRSLTLCACLLALTACSPEKNEEKTAASQAAASSSNHIASAVLNVEQGEDILQSSKQAMLDINASDIAAAQFQPEPMLVETLNSSDVQAASLPSDLLPLPERCQAYFQRAQSCYQTQAQADGLISMLQQQQAELAAENPDEAVCQNLARSFDAVAMNLGCQ
ncbi:hypothetical protein ACKLNO_04890 [Neisseriaceae bacterium B1]